MIRALLLTSRPLSWVNTAFPFAAAYLVSTGRVDATLIVGTVFFLIPYNLAMYGINDVFDYESDVRNPRKGGVEGALLEPRWHRATLVASGVLALPFVVYLVAVGSPASWLVLAISLFAVVAYSVKGLRFKERPFLDSITSSTHFVSPAVYGLALGGRRADRAGHRPARRVLPLGRGIACVRRRAGHRGRPRSRHRLGGDGDRRAGDRAAGDRRSICSPASCCSPAVRWAAAGSWRSPRCSPFRTCSTRCRGGASTTKTPPPRIAGGGASCG